MTVFIRRDVLHLLALGGPGLLLGCGSRRQEAILPSEVNGCVLDPTRLAALLPCMQSCGPEEYRDAWDHSCIHPNTGAYACGRLVMPDGPNRHEHDPDELLLCRQLAGELAELLAGIEINQSEGSSEFFPFFVTANLGDEVPDRLTPSVIRALFGGTIYPRADIVIAPLQEGGSAWEEFAASRNPPGHELSPADQELYKAPLQEDRKSWQRRCERWREALRWFNTQIELHGSAFVLVGEAPLSEINGGCVFPRLAVGITRGGSLAGVCAHVVHT